MACSIANGSGLSVASHGDADNRRLRQLRLGCRPSVDRTWPRTVTGPSVCILDCITVHDHTAHQLGCFYRGWDDRGNWLRVALTAMALGVGLYIIPFLHDRK